MLLMGKTRALQESTAKNQATLIGKFTGNLRPPKDYLGFYVDICQPFWAAFGAFCQISVKQFVAH
jgi:hypothetical protein